MATNRARNRARDLESDSIIRQNLEEENENSINSLADKVKEIKNLSLGIKGFITKEKNHLGNMIKDYDKSTSLMDLSMKKMDQLLSSKAGRLSCYLTCCVLFVFLVLWILG